MNSLMHSGFAFQTDLLTSNATTLPRTCSSAQTERYGLISLPTAERLQSEWTRSPHSVAQPFRQVRTLSHCLFWAQSMFHRARETDSPLSMRAPHGSRSRVGFWGL